MESPLVAVFLAVIALTALLQAGFVAAVAFGLRRGNQKLGEFEETFETGVVPRIREAAKLTDRAAELAEKTLAQAHRMDGVVGDVSRKAERYMDQAAAKLGDRGLARRDPRRLGARRARGARPRAPHRAPPLQRLRLHHGRAARARGLAGHRGRPGRRRGRRRRRRRTTWTSTASRPTPARPELDHRGAAHAAAVRAIERDQASDVGRQGRARQRPARARSLVARAVS